MKRIISLILVLVLMAGLSSFAFGEEGNWTCSNGHENPVEHNFCSVCGEAQPAASDADQTDIAWKEPFENEEYETAFPLVQETSDKGDIEATAALAMYYIYGYGETEKDFDKGLELAQKAADAGNARGMFLVGRCYNFGQGVNQSYQKAAEWYQKSADLGDSWAMGNLGSLYEYGSGVSQNYQKALDLYLKSAELGNSDAMLSLGSLYDRGAGVTQDYRKAEEWYIKAAEAGESDAAARIGWMYLVGEGVEKDPAKAGIYLEQAAEAGIANSMNNLGNMYRNGVGVTKDYSKAMSWLLKAADNGNVTALSNVGLMYDRGEGVTKDRATALIWYMKAVEAGYIPNEFLMGYWSSNNGAYTFEVKENGSFSTTIPVVPQSGDSVEFYNGMIRRYFANNPNVKTDVMKISVISENEIDIYSYQTKTTYSLIRRR